MKTIDLRSIYTRLGALTARTEALERLKKWPPLEVKVFADIATVATGDGAMIIAIASDLGGFNLIDADAYITTVSSSGLVTVQVRNITQAADMLTTPITIDVGEYTSFTAAIAPLIDTANDGVAAGDLIAFDVDVAGTGAKGLGVILRFGI